MEQKQPLQQMVLGDLYSYVQKNEIRTPTYAIHKNKLTKSRGMMGEGGGSAGVGWSDGEKRHTTVIE